VPPARLEAETHAEPSPAPRSSSRPPAGAHTLHDLAPPENERQLGLVLSGTLSELAGVRVTCAPRALLELDAALLRALGSLAHY